MKKNIFGEVPKVVHNAVLDALDSLEEPERLPVWKQPAKGKGRRGILRLSGAAAACLICFLAAGLTASALGLISLYRQRMESMDTEEIQDYYQIAKQGETTEYSRPLTAAESARYNLLKEEYENNGRFPQGALQRLKEGESYNGMGIVLSAMGRTVYLPAEELTDEELLELIDFDHKITYSFYQVNQERIVTGGGLESRLAQLSDAEVDALYLAWTASNADVGGGTSRELTQEEAERQAELLRRYEEEGLYTENEIAVIGQPDEYTGSTIAFCKSDSIYYLPERSMTDDELLQMIDFNHKISYAMSRIYSDIQMGLRDGWPQ